MMKSVAGLIVVSTMFIAGQVFADVRIQSAQYNENKGEIFLKGKADHSTLYVVNAETNASLATINASRGQFKEDLSVSPVPCRIRVQTNPPSLPSDCHFCSMGSAPVAEDAGISDERNVRHAPVTCQ